jgi:hypothetical protein
MDAKFEEVKEYVYDHPGVGIQEVSDPWLPERAGRKHTFGNGTQHQQTAS